MNHHAGLHVTGFDTTDGHGADTADRVDILESETTSSQRVSTELAVVVTPPTVHAPRRVRSILLLAGKSDVEDMRTSWNLRKTRGEGLPPVILAESSFRIESDLPEQRLPDRVRPFE